LTDCERASLATIVVCPNCGHHFNRPFITEKRSGFGFSFGALGAIKCPQCGYKAGWEAFKKEKDVPPDYGVDHSKPKAPSPGTPEQEKEKTLDETKFESS